MGKRPRPVWLYLVGSVRRDLQIEGPSARPFDASLVEHIARIVAAFGRPCTVFVFGAPVDAAELFELAQERKPIYNHRWCLAMAKKDKVHQGLSVTMDTHSLTAWLHEG